MTVNTASGRDIDKGWAWLVLFASYINLLLCSGLGFVAGMFQLLFLEHFQGSVAVTSWITALFSSFMQLGGPLSSAVSNCFNCRISVMMGGVLMSVGLFASSMANSLELLFVTFGLIAGVGLALTYTASIVVINYFFLEKRTLVTGLALSAGGLGIVVTPQIARFVFDNFAWREALVITAAASAQICVTGALMSSMHETQGKSRIFERCLSCIPGHRLQTSNRAYECSYELKEEETAIMEIQSQERLSTDLKGAYNAKDEQIVGSNSSSDILHSWHEENNVEEVNQSSPIATGVSNHQPINLRKDLEPSAENDSKISIVVDTVASQAKVSTSSSELPELNRHENFPPRPIKIAHFGSHQELASKPLLQKALTKASHINSQQQLVHRIDKSPITQSNPNFIHNLAVGQSSRSLALSKTSLNSGNFGSVSRIVVVSRNPSLQGLVPSTSHLDVIKATEPNVLNSDSLHASSMFESQVILKASLGAMNKENNENDKERNEEEDMAAFKKLMLEYPALYRNKYFLLLCTCLFIANAGCGIFILHLASFVHRKGLTDQELTNVLSANGFGLLFGRCMTGALANSVKDSDLLIWWALHILGGLAMCFLPFVGQSYVSMVILVYLVGNYNGSTYAVLSSLTIEIVGLSSLATAFGIEMICAGFSFLISPPLAGVLVDLTDSYDISIFIGGLLIIASGMVSLLLPLLGLQLGRSTHADDVIGDENGCDINVEDVR